MTGSYDYVKKYNGEKVQSDPNLIQSEREVFIYLWPSENGNAIVEANKTSIVRGLINHNEASVKRLRKYNRKVVGGTFYIPIGCIKIQKHSRNTNHLSRVVSR